MGVHCKSPLMLDYVYAVLKVCGTTIRSASLPGGTSESQPLYISLVYEDYNGTTCRYQGAWGEVFPMWFTTVTLLLP